MKTKKFKPSNTQKRLIKAREIAFNVHAPVQVRLATTKDAVNILNVEWAVFRSFSDMNGRWLPSKLTFWLKKAPQMFLVAEVLDNKSQYTIGYTVLVPLGESGYHKFLTGQGRSIVHLSEDDVDLSDDPKYLSLEVVACINPTDIYTGMLLIRNAISMIPSSCEVFTAAPASVMGLKLVQRFNFQKVWEDHSNDWTLFALDLEDPINRELFRKLRIQT